jgi:hypothetical protein
MYPKQIDAIFTPARYSVIEASTKSGKTVGCIIWLFEQALQGKIGNQYWWIAPVRDQSKIAFKRLKRYLDTSLYDAHEQALEIHVRASNTIIAFKTADKPDSLYGEDVYAMVIDEATRCKEEAWIAARTTITATGGPVRVIGNVKGRRNWAYQLARRAESGEPGWHYAKITAWDAIEAGVLDEAEVLDAKSVFRGNTAAFKELYEAEPSDDEGCPFGTSESIGSCIGNFSTETPVVWGWDLAKSVDWTVGIALDQHGHCTQLLRWQRPWNETIDQIVELVGDRPALIDSTGLGDPVLESLQKRARALNTGAHFEGFKFSSSSKQQLIEGLVVSIGNGQVRYPEGVVTNELMSFQYEYTPTGVRYSAPSGMHDDCVCALALAVEARRRFANKDWRLLEFDHTSSHTQERLDAIRKSRASHAVSQALKSDGVYWPEG